MRTRTKVLIVVALAAFYFYLSQHRSAHTPSRSEIQLKKLYDMNNEQYFGHRLPTDAVVDWGEADDKYMATTDVMSDGRFHVAFNENWTRGDQTVEFVMLHEMCHVKLWDGTTKGTEHGPRWRACMLELDSAGAFREIFINEYQEKM